MVNKWKLKNLQFNIIFLVQGATLQWWLDIAIAIDIAISWQYSLYSQ